MVVHREAVEKRWAPLGMVRHPLLTVPLADSEKGRKLISQTQFEDHLSRPEPLQERMLESQKEETE
jgi:hypothetical protein